MLETVEHKDGKWKLDGRDFHQFTLVATVIQSHNTNVALEYMLDDGTGQFSATVFTASENVAPQVHRDGVYVRVYGMLKNVQGVKSLTAFKMTEVKDHNDLTYHMLDVIQAFCKTKWGFQALSGAAVGASNNAKAPMSAGGSVSNSAYSSNNYGSAGSGMTGSVPKGQGQVLNPINSNVVEDLSNTAALERAVLKLFMDDAASSASEQGTSVQTLYKALPSVAPNDIRRAVDHLSEEGHLYSTIDEDHFKPTAS